MTGTNGSVTVLSNGTAPSLNASMIYNITSKPSFGIRSASSMGGVIIVGTIGNSSIIDRLVGDGKINVSSIEGTWEAYTSTVVRNPMKGIAEAMVIAGEHNIL